LLEILTRISRSEKVLFMRVFISVLVLIFSLQSWTKADDIKDFQIEGMSIGDSLLDHFSEQEIKKKLKPAFHYKNKKFSIIYVHDFDIEIYQRIAVTIIPTDPKYILYSVRGEIDFPEDIDNCKKKKDEIVKDIDEIFKKLKKREHKLAHGFDKTGKSFVYTTEFAFANKDEIRVFCLDWTPKITQEEKWEDTLNVTLSTWKLINFLNTEAFE
jgi:hypothetical protein